jgi:hypothetical protein
MTGKVVLSVGMPRAGSGWYFNLTHDLLVAAGYQDAHRIRDRYRLQNILTQVNLNIGALTARRTLAVTIPALLGNVFAVKAHAGPTPIARSLIRRRMLQPTYIYRDPRDALLSAYEYGQRARRDNRENAFTRLRDLDQAIAFMLEYTRISEAWMGCEETLKTSYEDLLQDYDHQARRLTEFLGLDVQQPAIKVVMDKYRPEHTRSDQKGLHLVKGKIGRFRIVFNDEQKEQLNRAFGDYLTRMGYPI